MENKLLLNLATEASEVTRSFKNEFGQLNDVQFNWKPNPNQWSIGECIDHLIVSNQLYFPKFEAVANGQHISTIWQKLPWLPSFWGKMLLKIVSPDYPKNSKTLKIFEPTASDFTVDLIQEFENCQQKLVTYFEQMDHINLDKIIITSPASALITYPLKDACKVLIEHEKRHFNQAFHVKEQAEFPA